MMEYYLCEIDGETLCEPDDEGFGPCGDLISECPNARYLGTGNDIISDQIPDDE